jgi:feruloyl-CoA synthase
MVRTSDPPPFFAPPNAAVERRPDGSVIVRSLDRLGEYPKHVGVMLRRWARDRPNVVFLAERDGTRWRRVTYEEALRAAESIGETLLDRGLGPDRPLLILSGNSADHGLLTMGALLAGVPVAPVSPAYSLMSDDKAKVIRIVEQIRPGLVFVEDGTQFQDVLHALPLDGAGIVSSRNPPRGLSAMMFGDLLGAAPGESLRRAEALVGPDTVAKYLFTSGSTGLPKGVVNTQRMLCSNQQMIAQCWPFVTRTPPVLVDWLPWNHTFGGNHNFNLVLSQGGTLHIDGGKPTPQMIEMTVTNLRSISPTIYFNVPIGYAMLLPFLEGDSDLRQRFFANLQLIMYAGAALPQDLWDRLEAVALKTVGRKLPMVSAWGSTETAPMATTVHFPIEAAGTIGLPPPGVEVKMVPSGSKTELRVRGPNVTPGYVGDAVLTREAFDDEGFYRIGDAGRWADEGDPHKGIVFDGRVAEDFKLLSGTWVSVGTLRVQALADTGPALQDVVVCGHDRGAIGLLAWPNISACRGLARLPETAELADVLSDPAVIAHIREGLHRHNAARPGSSTRVDRVLLMTEPPSIDDNEVTDKGYINQRATLERRHALVDRLYADPVVPGVIVI